MNIRRTVLACTAALSLAASACSHVVTIDSEPPGATIYVNGEKQGTAPVQYTEKTGWSTAYRIEAKKKGYAKTQRTVQQTEWHTGMMVGSIIAGTCILFPWGYAGLAFARQMPDHVTVELEKGGSGGGGGGSSEGGSDYDYGY